MKKKDLMRVVIGLLIVLIVLQLGSILLNVSDPRSMKNLIIRDEFIGLGETDFSKVAEKATPSVVFIGTDTGSGSGIIVREDGIIITNDHVVRNSSNITVRLSDKRIFRAEIVGGDSSADVAVVKIGADNLSTLEFADSDKVEVGQPVLAIGNPFGFDFTVTTGIISAKHRDRGPTDFRDFLQTDASINPGNSGGPLVNLKGKVIGINTFIVTDERAGELGFAIPSNLVKDITTQIIEKGKVDRGFMGLIVRDVIDLDENGSGSILEGSLVEDVLEDGPSDKAGVQDGDFIKKINNVTIENSNGLRNLIASIRPGERITVTVERNETLLDIEIELSER